MNIKSHLDMFTKYINCSGNIEYAKEYLQELLKNNKKLQEEIIIFLLNNITNDNIKIRIITGIIFKTYSNDMEFITVPAFKLMTDYFTKTKICGTECLIKIDIRRFLENMIVTKESEKYYSNIIRMTAQNDEYHNFLVTNSISEYYILSLGNMTDDKIVFLNKLLCRNKIITFSTNYNASVKWDQDILLNIPYFDKMQEYHDEYKLDCDMIVFSKVIYYYSTFFNLNDYLTTEELLKGYILAKYLCYDACCDMILKNIKYNHLSNIFVCGNKTNGIELLKIFNSLQHPEIMTLLNNL